MLLVTAVGLVVAKVQLLEEDGEEVLLILQSEIALFLPLAQTE